MIHVGKATVFPRETKTQIKKNLIDVMQEMKP